MKWDEYDLFRSRTWMRLNRTEIEKRYPSEELRLTLMDELTLLDRHYREIQRLLSGKQWKALANQLSFVKKYAEDAEGTLNMIIFPKLPVEMNVDVPDDTPRESER